MLFSSYFYIRIALYMRFSVLVENCIQCCKSFKINQTFSFWTSIFVFSYRYIFETIEKPLYFYKLL